jgi:2-oxoglutarate ferredoxin oxidoreductase subunit alpha
LIEEARSRGVEVFPVPFLDLLKEVASQLGIEKLSKITRIKNVLALGVTFGLLSYDVELVDKSIRAVFRSKVGVADMNISAHRRAYDYAKQNFGDRFPSVLSKLDVQDKRLLVSGFQAVALGKVFGGCRLQSYYPITPAADESEYLEAHEVFGLDDGSGSIVIMQAEDEIAAVNMASGAALTGVRTATATSGPGFSLMVEGLSWAGNNEVPIVITYYQRGAPSTGLPTRHGQDDLRFVIHAGHGEFPRIVLASGDIRECFYDAARALNYAEKYQTPVIHLVDKAIANSSQSLAPFDKKRLKIERGTIIKTWDDPNVNYKRFEFTNNYMSPRAFLGTPNAVMWYTGDEHDELGHISEEPLNRDLMMEKRMRKLEVASAEIPLEEKINFLGQKGAENILVSWGSPKGAVVEAMEKLHHEGVSISFLQVRLIHPFASKEIGRLLKESKRRIAVEMNYSGQLANIIAEKTGIPIDNQIVKYNGRPMTTTEVYEATRKIIFGKARKREVLTYGS